MIRLVGGIFLMTGGLLLGLAPMRELSRRAELLERWGNALLLLEGELTFSMPAMPQLLAELSRRLPAPVGDTFGAVGKGMERLGEYSFGQIWEKAVTERSGLTGQDLAPLRLLGEVLGRYDGEERKKALENAKARLFARETACREELRSKGRAYGTLGLAAGTFAVILLL